MEVKPTPENGNTTYISFNQDASRVVVCSLKGYSVYSCSEDLRCTYTKEGMSTSLVAMLFSTSLVAQVGYGDTPASNQRMMQIWNIRREMLVTTRSYPVPIVTIAMNRQRLVAVAESALHIYDVGGLDLLHTIPGTPKNPRGVCALAARPEAMATAAAAVAPSVSAASAPAAAAAAAASASASPIYFCYPGSATEGTVLVFDVANLRSVTAINAHASPVACLALSPSGELLATASQKGTVLRVYSLPSGKLVREFRRGTHACTVYSMSFSVDEKMLAVSSDRVTVHVFRLDDGAAPAHHAAAVGDGGEAQGTANGGGVAGWASSFFSSVGAAAAKAAALVPSGYIPTETRDFARATLPPPATPALCALTVAAAGPVLVVVTAERKLYKYGIDVVAGGECKLLETHVIPAIGQNESAGAVTAAEHA